MKALLWICRILIFLFLFAFAINNKEIVTVWFFAWTAWQAPLIIVILASFAVGAVLGVLALLGTVFDLRRELSRLKREIRLQEGKTAEVPAACALPPK